MEKIESDIFIVMLVVACAPAAMAILPWDFNQDLDQFSKFIRSFGFSSIVIEVFCIVSALKRGFRVSSLAPILLKREKVLFCILVVIAFATALFVSPSRKIALLRTIFWFIHILFGLSINFLFRNEDKGAITKFWYCVIAGILAYILILLIFVFSLSSPETFRWVKGIPGMVNVRSLGFPVIVGACSAIALAVFETNWLRLIGLVLAASCIIALGAWSGSRGAFFALISSGFIAAFLSPIFRAKKSIAIYFISIILGLFISTLHEVPHSSFGISRFTSSTSNTTIDTYSSGRISVWEGTISAIEYRPFFGYGEGQFPKVVKLPFGKFNQPHNLILQLVFHWGLVGCFCFLFLVVPLSLKLVWQFRTFPREVAPSFMIVFGLLVFSLYDAALFYPYPIMMAAAALGLASAAEASRSPSLDVT